VVPLFKIRQGSNLKTTVKGKVKMSLSLTELHALKTYWRSGGIVPRII